MKALWAPWRMEYIAAPKPRGGECLLCALQTTGDERSRLILWRGPSACCILNRYPYNPGHLMVSPYAHTDQLAALPAATQQELIWMLGEASAIALRVLRAEGLNCGMNIGRTAGAGIVDHLHFHIVPRWNGDTNFLPVLADTKAMPQYLDETYRALAPDFAALPGGGPNA
ncbi:MAG: HIT domain-containing protein [Deltaproteobacteria bacterium]|nr:HIT domain-containing protein [Deltaproteobacteria bacterium]